MSETIADRYLLLRPLAEGGMGEVFLARHRGHLDLAMSVALAAEPARASRWLARAHRRIREAHPGPGQAVVSDEVRLAARLLQRGIASRTDPPS